VVTHCRSCGRGLSSTHLPAPVPRGANTASAEPSSTPPPPMPVVRPPWEAARLPDDLGVPEPDAPQLPTPPTFGPGSAYADWPLRLPIALHLTLYTLGSMAAFLGVPWLMVTRVLGSLPRWLPAPVAFLGGAIAGLFLAKAAFRYLILGRCPKCKGGAVLRGGSPITYTCQACGHVHRSALSGG